MAEPVIVPPTPTVTQPSHPPPPTPEDTSPGLDQMQKIFDRVLPDTRKPTPSATAPTAPDAPPAAPAQPAPGEQPPAAPTEQPPGELKIPSFLEEALKPEPPATQQPIDPEADFPDDLPPEQKQSRIKGLREAYTRVKGELDIARQRTGSDPQERARLQFLEGQNRQMQEVLSRVGVEHSPQFQQQIIAPLTASWHEAARIVRDAGGDPQELAKAMTLQGKAQFEALDMLFSEMPESAKTEAHDALRTYRRFEEARQRAVANAPRTLEALRAQDAERQYQELGKQRQGMTEMFDQALTRLRDEAKVEVFQQTNDPETKWWNEQREQIINQGKSLFLENTDMNKVALACLLAPAADAYRKLFLKSQQKVGELNKIIKDRLGGEPTLSESGGNAGSLLPEAQMQEDLKKPFDQVFLREFHKAQGRSQR